MPGRPRPVPDRWAVQWEEITAMAPAEIPIALAGKRGRPRLVPDRWAVQWEEITAMAPAEVPIALTGKQGCSCTACPAEAPDGSAGSKSGNALGSVECQMSMSSPIGKTSQLQHSPSGLRKMKRERLAFVFSSFSMQRYAYSDMYILTS